MYLSILFCGVYSNLDCSMVRICCLSGTAIPDNDTRLQTTDINETFDLHNKFVYEVITLHRPQEKVSSKIWQSNVVVGMNVKSFTIEFGI